MRSPSRPTGLRDRYPAHMDVQGKPMLAECHPMVSHQRAQLAPDASIPFGLKQIPATECQGAFTTDSLVDKVFWEGRLACEWMFAVTSFGLNATGADRDTGFSAAIRAQDLASRQPVKRHDWKGGHPGSISDRFSEEENISIEKPIPEIRNDLLLSPQPVRYSHEHFRPPGHHLPTQ